MVFLLSRKISSFIFSRNTLKSCRITPGTILRKPHVRQNSRSGVTARNIPKFRVKYGEKSVFLPLLRIRRENSSLVFPGNCLESISIMSGTIQWKPHVWQNSRYRVTVRNIPTYGFEISIFGRFLNSMVYFSLNFSVKHFKIIQPNCLHNSVKTACMGKFRLWSYGPKRSQIWVGKCYFLGLSDSLK